MVGELNEIFLEIEFRFRNGLSRTIALQSYRITYLINAEILAKFCTMRETKIKWKKIHFNVRFPTYYKIYYNKFQMNYNAFCFAGKKDLKPFSVHFCGLTEFFCYQTKFYQTVLQ